MTIDYVKLSPTENITILVRTPVPRARHAEIAAMLLRDVGGEQAGFIEAPAGPEARSRLQMMGGEFCGNAAISLGALLARGDLLADGAVADMALEVSGSGAPVPCRMRREGAEWIGTVGMPLPTAFDEIILETDAGPLSTPLVRMPGIAHLIIPANACPDEGQLRRRLPEWNRAIGADALGALAWDESASAIDPLVYVPSAGTLVRERGCGSGSAAVGCWLAAWAGHSLRTAVSQPGGVIEVDARMEGGAPISLTITGRVRIIEEGQYSTED